jgi:hypothetical protein
MTNLKRIKTATIRYTTRGTVGIEAEHRINSTRRNPLAVLVLIAVAAFYLLGISLRARTAELTDADRAAILKLADRVEVIFLEGRDEDLPAYVRPKQGLFIDLWGDWEPEGESSVHIAYEDTDELFADVSEREWGPGEVGRGECMIVGAVPYVLLYGWHENWFLHGAPVEDNPVWGEILSLPEMMRRYDDKRIDELAIEPANHSFAYDEYHYVQYWLQCSQLQGDFWFLIVDKDEHGWFLKGFVHMDRWVI